MNNHYGGMGRSHVSLDERQTSNGQVSDPRYVLVDRSSRRDSNIRHQPVNVSHMSPCPKKYISLSPSPSPQYVAGTFYQVSPERPITKQSIANLNYSPVVTQFVDVRNTSDKKKTDLSIRELDSLQSQVQSAASNEE